LPLPYDSTQKLSWIPSKALSTTALAGSRVSIVLYRKSTSGSIRIVLLIADGLALTPTMTPAVDDALVQ